MTEQTLGLISSNSEAIAKLLHLSCDLRIFLLELINLLTTVENCGVIFAPQCFTDLRQAQVSVVAHQEHCHLSGLTDLSLARVTQ